jgi:hypothetical protein
VSYSNYPEYGLVLLKNIPIFQLNVTGWRSVTRSVLTLPLQLGNIARPKECSGFDQSPIIHLCSKEVEKNKSVRGLGAHPMPKNVTSVIRTTWFARLVHNCLRNRMINRDTSFVVSLQGNNRGTLMTDPAPQRFTKNNFWKSKLVVSPHVFGFRRCTSSMRLKNQPVFRIVGLSC